MVPATLTENLGDTFLTPSDQPHFLCIYPSSGGLWYCNHTLPRLEAHGGCDKWRNEETTLCHWPFVVGFFSLCAARLFSFMPPTLIHRAAAPLPN